MLLALDLEPLGHVSDDGHFKFHPAPLNFLREDLQVFALLLVLLALVESRLRDLIFNGIDGEIPPVHDVP